MTNRKRRGQRTLTLVFLILIFGILSFGASGFILNSPMDKDAEPLMFIVNPGESFSEVSLNLKGDDRIRSYYFFRILDRFFSQGRVINSGSYQLSASMSSWRIYQKLINSEQDWINVTIPEGWTLRQIANLLEEKGITRSEDFIAVATSPDILEAYSIPADSCEGYLFPDTYRFPYMYDARYILEPFLENFQNQMDVIYPHWMDLSPEQLHEKITMASIVEREYRAQEEAPLISSVFYNRLDSWYPRLESCATVTYIITDIMELPHPERLTTQDIEMDHEYNTYERSGLPPGPISNPGTVALEAAFYPADTNYIYFVVKDLEAGTHNFSSNYDDFMAHKLAYLRNYRSK